MDYATLTTARDDIVRDGADFEAYRRPATLIDSDHPKIRAYASRIAGDSAGRETALRLYYAVRDELRYDPYNTPMKAEAYRASTTLEAGRGFCINKAGLLAAVCRAAGIPARVGYADVRNHITTERLTELLGLKPLDWDGVSDSIYHPFDLSGRRHMEYLAYRGVFADIPFEEIHGAFRHYYPRMTSFQEKLPLLSDDGGDDFGAEGAAEAVKPRG